MTAENQTCIICNNDSPFLFRKETSDYFQCNNCLTVFCEALNQEGMIGGEFEEERNDKENYLRVDRVDEITKGYKQEEIHILDFGCGSGLFIDDLKNAGYQNVDGYDAYNEKFWRLPEKNKYMVVSMTEVIEHMATPFLELGVIFRALKPGGAVLIETSFVDVAVDEGIPLKDFFYIAPQSGHSTIFSHHSLDLLMAIKGFIPRNHFNRHVRLYQKPVQ